MSRVDREFPKQGILNDRGQATPRQTAHRPGGRPLVVEAHREIALLGPIEQPGHRCLEVVEDGSEAVLQPVSLQDTTGLASDRAKIPP